MSDNSVGSKVSVLLVGLGIGSLVGILFAPKSGEETRDYFSGKADEGRDYAQKKAREFRERAEDLIERSREVMSRQKDALSSAVDAGKETYRRNESFLSRRRILMPGGLSVFIAIAASPSWCRWRFWWRCPRS